MSSPAASPAAPPKAPDAVGTLVLNNDAWLARRPPEPILEPELAIIDPHHHLWDRTAAIAAASGPPKHGLEAMLRMVPHYLFDELLADMTRGHNVIGTVYMECGSMYRADAAPVFQPRYTELTGSA